MKVLYVEDEKEHLEQAKLLLQKEDERLNFDTTSSGEEGLEKLQEGEYDAIVSDYKMPGMDGLELLKTIREKNKEIPLIIFTGKGEENVAMKALNWGANHYLKKGGDPKTQYGVLARAIVQEIENHKTRKKEEEEKKKCQAYFEQAGSLIVAINTDQEVIHINQKGCEILGYDRNEVIGSNWFDNFIPKENQESLKNEFNKLMEGEIEKDEYTEYEIKTKERGNKTIAWHNTILKNNDGEIEGILLSGTDITRKKKAEEREEFLHSLLRHDISNKIQIIRNSLSFLKDTELTEEQRKFLEFAVKAREDGSRLIEKVRTFREIGKDEVKDVDLDKVIGDSIDELDAIISDKDIEIDFKESGLKVRGGFLLEEAFENLIENSLKHSEGTKLKISAQEKDEEVMITVEDDGKGIEDKDKDRIFAREFKKGENAGTGLGMYLVKKIIRSYSGRIEAKDSELGGAKFEIHLKKA